MVAMEYETVITPYDNAFKNKIRVMGIEWRKIVVIQRQEVASEKNHGTAMGGGAGVHFTFTAQSCRSPVDKRVI